VVPGITASKETLDRWTFARIRSVELYAIFLIVRNFLNCTQFFELYAIFLIVRNFLNCTQFFDLCRYTRLCIYETASTVLVGLGTYMHVFYAHVYHVTHTHRELHID
jgi:hypothetical protein